MTIERETLTKAGLVEKIFGKIKNMYICTEI